MNQGSRDGKSPIHQTRDLVGHGRVSRHETARPRRVAPYGGDGLALSYFRTFSRYRMPVLLCAALGLLASFLFDFTMLPVYRAKTTIDVQTLNGDFMNMHSVAPTNDSGSNSDAFVQTQIKLLQSETLLEHTASRLQSEHHPDAVLKNDLASRLKRLFHIGGRDPISYSTLVNDAIGNVKVKPVGLTRLIEITCDSWNHDFSVKFCDTLTSEFQEEDRSARGAEAKKTSDWLTQQAEDIRMKAQDAEKQLEVAVGGNGLMLSQGANTVGEDRLRDIQQELIRAKADRMEKEAQTAIASSSSPDTVPGIVDRPAYQSYQQKLADLRAQVAQLVPPLTEENPKVIHLRSQITEVESGLEAERSADAARLQNQYDASRHREFLLNATYQATLANVSSDLGKAARVSLMKREVDSEQQLYQTLMQRAKEAGFASAMQASTVRVIDVARAEGTPVSPRRGKAEIIGLLLGSLAGLGFAIFRDRNFQKLRMPGDVQSRLHVHELGVIPSADGTGSQLVAAARSLTLRGEERREVQDPLALARWNDDFSIMAEAYRTTTLSILLSDLSSKVCRVFVIASPSASDGKTSVTSNLGVALSKSKQRVLLIDGDMRRPWLHTALKVRNNFGLRDLLRSNQPIQDPAALEACVRTEIPNLWILPSGTGNEGAVELLHSGRVSELIRHLGSSFDTILIDTPPMLHMADARIFAGHADGVILIVRSGVTSLDDAARALDLFDRDGVHVLGTILNDFNAAREGHSNYYNSYNRYKEGLKPPAEEASLR